MERILYKFNNISIKNIEDTELMQKFAIACIERKELRKDIILKAIRDYVENHEKEKNKRGG